MDRKDLERSKQFPHLGAAFRTNVEQFGPNDFFVMQKCMKEVSFRSPLLLSWLKFSNANVTWHTQNNRVLIAFSTAVLVSQYIAFDILSDGLSWQ